MNIKVLTDYVKLCKENGFTPTWTQLKQFHDHHKEKYKLKAK